MWFFLKLELKDNVSCRLIVFDNYLTSSFIDFNQIFFKFLWVFLINQIFYRLNVIVFSFFFVFEFIILRWYFKTLGWFCLILLRYLLFLFFNLFLIVTNLRILLFSFSILFLDIFLFRFWIAVIRIHWISKYIKYYTIRNIRLRLLNNRYLYLQCTAIQKYTLI